MKKLLSAMLIIAFNYFATLAQTFEKTLSFQASTIPYVVKEFSNFYILSTFSINEQTGAWHSKLFKLDFNGKLIDSLDFKDYYDYRIYDIIPLPNDEFICCGSFATEKTDTLIIIFDKYTACFENITSTKNKINTKITRLQSGQACVINENISTFVYAYDAFDGSSNKGYHFFNIDNNCSVLAHNYMNNQHGKQIVVDDFIPYKEDTLVLFSRFETYKIDNKLTFSDSVSRQAYEYNDKYDMGFQFNALKLEDEIIISGWYANNGMADSLIMTLGLFNESFDFLKYIRIGSNYLQNNRAILHSLSAFNNKVYLCGVNNFSWFKFYGNSSSIRLLKLDNNLNEIWDKSYYENDEYYYLPIVTLATKDGGNLMVSTKYHNDQTDEILSVHLLKVDSLGNYIPNTVEDIAATKQGIRVYPNPGTTELNFSMPDNYNSVAVNLYTLSGTKIRSKPLVNNNSSMNTENLPNGIYIWEVQTSNGYKERGKWIKQ